MAFTVLSGAFAVAAPASHADDVSASPAASAPAGVDIEMLPITVPFATTTLTDDDSDKVPTEGSGAADRQGSVPSPPPPPQLPSLGGIETAIGGGQCWQADYTFITRNRWRAELYRSIASITWCANAQGLITSLSALCSGQSNPVAQWHSCNKEVGQPGYSQGKVIISWDFSIGYSFATIHYRPVMDANLHPDGWLTGYYKAA